MRQNSALILIGLMISVGLPSATLAADAGGKALYEKSCAGCHGADGKGATPAGKSMGAHDFSSPDVQKQSDVDLEQIIAKGKNKMPSYANKLKPAEIKDLVAYVRKLGKG